MNSQMKTSFAWTCKCTHVWYWIFIGTLGLALEFEQTIQKGLLASDDQSW